MRKWFGAWTFIGFQFYGLQSERVLIDMKYLQRSGKLLSFGRLLSSDTTGKSCLRTAFLRWAVLPCENFTQPSPGTDQCESPVYQTFMKTAFLEWIRLLRLWCTFEKVVMRKFIYIEAQICYFQNISLSFFHFNFLNLTLATFCCFTPCCDPCAAVGQNKWE